MSLSRNSLQEVCDFVGQNSSQLLGKRFLDCRMVLPIHLQLALNKLEKGELRFFVVSKFRVFLLAGKSVGSLKVERSFNVLALKSLQVVSIAQQESGLNIGWEDRQQRMCSVLIRSALDDGPDPLAIALQILSALKHYFPDIRQSLPRFLQLAPPALHTLFSQLPHSTPDLPCHNFRRSYVAVCDQIEQPFRDEVLWDIERIYFTHDLHDLRLEDFFHLGVKDQIAILACAQFSSYFTGITVDGIRVTQEHLEVLLNVVRRSHALKSLRMVNCQLPKEFTVQLAQAIQHNHEVLPLETLDLSGNSLDDKKAMAQLAQALTRIQSLKVLVLSECSLSEKSIHHLAYGLYNGLGSQKFELRTLILSKNLLSKEYQEVNNELVNFVSLCQSLRHLDLSQTGFHIDKLWPALKLGGLKIEHLKLGGCQLGYSHKKHKEENAKTVRELFQSMIGLRELDLAGTPLNSETLQQILSGLANNQCIKELHLNLDATLTADKNCASVLEQSIATCPVSFLSMRDNALEQDALKVLSAIGTMKQLKCLDIGGSNLQALKSSTKKYGDMLARTLQEIITLISDEELVRDIDWRVVAHCTYMQPIKALEEVSLSDCHLGAHLNVVLNALGITRVKSLDLSGNEMGNFGARLLSKALQLNSLLRLLALDKNQISGDGFSELAHALKLNRTLITLPFPVTTLYAFKDITDGKRIQTVDIADALQRPDRQRTLSSLANIEMYLERNRRGVEHITHTCAQHLCHRLNSASHRYDINRNNEKKIAFHEVQKCLVDMGRNDLAPSASEIEAILEGGVLDKFGTAVDKAEADLRRRVHDSLAERNIKVTQGAVRNGKSCGLEEMVERQFRQELGRLATKYICESAWARLEEEVNNILSSPNGFKLSGPLSNLPIENSFHSGVHHRSGHRDNGDLAHRPNSILDESFQRQFGAVSLSPGEALATEDQVRMASLPKGSKLVHLAKNRPPPARRVRELVGQSNPPSPHTNDYTSTSQGAVSGESSPLKVIGTPETVLLPTTPPPLAPKRKGLVAMPPLLPPKPDSPPRQLQQQSPTQEPLPAMEANMMDSRGGGADGNHD